MKVRAGVLLLLLLLVWLPPASALELTGGGGGVGAQGPPGPAVADGDKGDVTVTSSGTVWTIDNTAVTYAKIQNVSATARLLGRNTAGAGPIEELTIATVKTMLGLSFGDLSGAATDAQIPDLNTLSTGLTPVRCVETDGTGKLGVAAAACGTGSGSTGISGASTNAPLYATGPTTATSTPPLTTGQVLVGSTGNPPMPATIGTVLASQYGVVCDGTTDTTTALQTVLNLRQAAPRTTTGFVVSMPQGGQCKLTATITIDSVNDLALQGNDVEFIWAGAAGIPMFVCRDCNLTRFENFRVRVSVSAPVSDVLRFENGAGSSITPTRNTVQFVTIECTNGGCGNGVVMALGAGGDANDEFNFFSHMNVQNYTGSCFRIEHAQSKHNFLSHVGCSGNSLGQHFLRVDPRGSFVCEHCTGGGHLGADFHVVNATDFATIRDSNFEGSAALLDTGGPATGPYPFNIENVRWDNTNLRANNRVIVYQYRGPLRISGLFVEQGPTPKPTEIFINPLGAIGSFVAEGNAIATTLADPFTFIRPTSQTSNIRYDGSSWIALQDRTQAIPPVAQALSAGTVITADACGGTKLLTATGAATTNTTNTFDAPAGGNVGCKMDVCNTAPFALTLDANANFRTVDGADVVLPASTASSMQCISVVQTGTQWVQLSAPAVTVSVPPFLVFSNPPTTPASIGPVDSNTIKEVRVTDMSGTANLDAPTGSPVEGQRLTYSLYSTVSRPLTYTTTSGGFAGEAGLTLPPKTIGGSYLILEFRWSAQSTRWALVSVSDRRPKTVAFGDVASMTINTNTTELAVYALGTATQSGYTVNLNTAATPYDGQVLRVRFTTSVGALAKPITWHSLFTGNAGITLPTVTTGNGTQDEFGFEWNEAAGSWVMLATSQNSQSARRRTCMIVVGADNGSVLTSADLGPQLHLCMVPSSAVVEEITVYGNAGASSVQVHRRTGTTNTNLLTGALPTAAAGALACARASAGATGYAGTACSGSVTLQNTTIGAGDTLGLTSGTADGTTARFTVAISYLLNS